MMIPDNYQINVSKKNVHYCKIELPDAFEEEAIRKKEEMEKLFGNEYELELTHVICYGKPIE